MSRDHDIKSPRELAHWIAEPLRHRSVRNMAKILKNRRDFILQHPDCQDIGFHCALSWPADYMIFQVFAMVQQEETVRLVWKIS